jgi:hypothetical protein
VLKTLFGGSPKWQSPDPAIRLAAVADLPADDPALAQLATTDTDADVRAAAIARVSVRPILERGLADPEPRVRAAAASAWAKQLGDDIPLGTPLEVVALALTEDSPETLRQAAVSVALNDLRSWLASGAPVSAKLAAVNACNDAATLDRLYLEWRDSDKRLGKACHDRAQALALRDKTAQEADVLLTQLQNWTEADDVPLSKLVEAQRAWAKLAPDEDRKARFEALTRALQLKMQNEALARRLHEQLAMQIAGFALKSKRAAELSAEELAQLASEATRAQSSPVLDAGLAQQLQAVHAAIATELELRERHAVGEQLLASRPAPQPVPQPTPASAPEPAAVPVEPPSASPPIETAGQATGDTAEATPPSPEAPASADASAAAPSEAPAAAPAAPAAPSPDVAAPTASDALAEWQARWDAWIATVDAATRARFEQRLAAITAPASAARDKPERAATQHASADELLAANAELTKLAELIAAGDVRGARSCASALFKTFTAKRYPKLEYDRLHELDREVKRLESWLKWSDAQARDALFARVEALKAAPPSIDAIVKEIRAVQEEWKALDKKNGGAPKPKWDRFNALCREAYAPAKAHFDQLKKQRAENAGARGEVIRKMSALADEASAALAQGNADWPALERRKLALFDEWKKAGSVANAEWKALDRQLDEALERLERVFDAAREPEIARRRRLIAQAEEQAKLPPSKAVTEATIAIQRRWTAERIANAPHLRRKDEQKLWDEFKRATDAVFKARDGQRDAMRAQFSEGAKARFALIDEVKALANGEDPKAIEQAIAQARARWRDAPMVEREKVRDLERKFDEAVLAARRRATLLSRGSVIEAMKATLAQVPATETSEKTAAALVIDAELIAGLESPPEIATARRMQQLKWLSERRQLPTAPEAKIQALRTLLGAATATGAKLTLGERERLVRAIEAVGAA